MKANGKVASQQLFRSIGKRRPPPTFKDAGSNIYNRLCPSDGRTVTLSSRTRENDSFEQIRVRSEILGSLDVSSHLLKMLFLSVGLSIHRSVCHALMNIIISAGVDHEQAGGRLGAGQEQCKSREEARVGQEH